MTVHAGPTIGAGCSASVSYNIGITNIEILRDGGRLLDNNAKCLPGERINLSVRGADPDSTYSWSITGDYFKNYTTSTPSVYEGAGAVPLNQPTIQYRYIKGDVGGADKTVTCSIVVGGTSVSVEDKLTVYQPEPTFIGRLGGWSSDFSGVVLSPPQGVQGLGMDWKGTTVTLTGYGNGEFAFLQTGGISRTGFNGSDSYSLPASKSYGLDKMFPYEGFHRPVGTVVGSIIEGENNNNAGDSPGDAFFGSVQDSSSTAPRQQAFDRLVMADSYDTYLMFHSSQTTACWVPLSEMPWSWSADAPRAAHNPPTSGTTINGLNSSNFPSWTRVINVLSPYIKN